MPLLDQDTPPTAEQRATEAARRDLLSRRGRFRITRACIRHDPTRFFPFFAEMIIVEAQARWENDCVEYLAISPRFAAVPEGNIAPFYDVTGIKNADGSCTYQIEPSPHV